jgi:hypothetical protein
MKTVQMRVGGGGVSWARNETPHSGRPWANQQARAHAEGLRWPERKVGMAERLVISVEGAPDRPDRMTVQDVFTHVIDLFQLVAESDPEAFAQIRWRLVSASMNSPFTVVAEAEAIKADIDPAPIANRQKRAFRRDYSELRQGHIPVAWSSSRARETVKQVVARNRNGIGITRIEDDESAALVLTHHEAEQVWASVVGETTAPRKTKDQIGSVEGRLVEVSTLYGKPAIKIKERKSDLDLWCTVPEAFQHEIAEHTSLEDVWRGSRVIVRGRITYATDGSIWKIQATSVRRVEAKNVSEEQIADRNFTGGLSVTEYLERLRDGSLG